MNDGYSEHHRLWDEALERAAPYPADAFQGRGIVTCAGGPRYFTCVWVLVRVLRELLKTSLPIQVWYRGAPEVDPLMRALLERHNVELVDACRVGPQPAPSKGWALKPFAILHSRFQEVVFLDSDNVPTEDPEILFGSAAYRETGAIFWPDLEPLAAESAIWEICRVPYRNEPSFESGQMVLDKARCWKALLLTMHMNECASFYYQHVLGDKDTFHLAWRFLGRPYSMVPYPVRLLWDDRADPLFVHRGPVLGQHDFQGRVIFQHRNWPKFMTFGKNPRYPEFVYEKECVAFLGELAGLWNGRVQSLELALPEESRSRSGSRWCRYIRLSDSEKWIELRPDQKIGYGSGQSERGWRVIREEGRQVLEILGDLYVTCRLIRHEDGVWRGRWLRYERGPVELIPWQA